MDNRVLAVKFSRHSKMQKQLFNAFVLFFLLGTISLQAQPEGFSDQLVSTGWNQATGLTFDENGRMYVWEKQGLVWIVENGVKLPDPLIDIREEITNYSDHGLLGFALHPNFLNNGYFFLLYPVDRHHLLYYGTPDYDPTITIREQAIIGRVTRYTADVNNELNTTLDNSRKILIGETIDTGLPLLHKSHGVGSLVFGNDGTLLISIGDGASYAGTDNGGDAAGSFAPQGLADGIIREEENVGAFRSQMINSHNGKVLRIDPLTGDGIASNPFYDAANPRAPQSRVWALGFRNPYRFAWIPGTGSHNPEDGDPGTFLLGDVGWAYWEEINRIDQPGMNFGWPIYEGMKSRWQYSSRKTENKDVPNPIYDGGNCGREFYYFQELLSQATENSLDLPNPCSPTLQIDQSLTFEHERPILTWSNFEWNDEEQDTYVPAYDSDGHALYYSLDDAQSPVSGSFFNGNCAISGAWYNGTSYPEEYQNSFYIADYTGWIKQLKFDNNGELVSVDSFSHASQNVVVLTLNPVDECLYYISFSGNSQIRRVCYGGNPPPTAIIEADKIYGASPLTVNFSAAQSFDPDGQSLTYLWDFGDGSTSTDIDPSHSFSAASNAPTPIEISLSVTDSEGEVHIAKQIISLNNTPPLVNITSLEDSSNYTTTGISEWPLEAAVSDAEHSNDELTYAWRTTLHHNSHFHDEPIDEASSTTTFVAGEGCQPTETFYYQIKLTVTDPAGLSTVDERKLFPYCGTPMAEFMTVDADAFDEYVRIEWESFNELAGILYEVERSADGLHFSSIGQISETGLGSYELFDQSPVNGENFYRILAIDPDGYFDFSKVVTARFPGRAAIELYPNPVLDEINVYFQEIEGEAEIHIYNLQGQIVRTQAWTDDREEVVKRMFVPNLAPGVYLYRVVSEQAVSEGKFIKHP